ncbi:MAG: hypothetical protein ACR2NP_04840 [Pirellulaceae bacterium]
MKQWLICMGGAIGMGLTWAAGWAVVGALIAVFSNLVGVPEESGLDPWIALATPGFVGGVIFAAVLGLAARGRGLDELSLLRLAAWGAVAGLMLGVLPFAMVAAGAASFNVSPWPVAAIVIPGVMLLSAFSAVGSALLFRYTAQDQPPAGIPHS